MLACVGGGVVDGLFDSNDIEPRVRFGGLFGVSDAIIFAITFFSINSSFFTCFWLTVDVTGAGVLSERWNLTKLIKQCR